MLLKTAIAKRLKELLDAKKGMTLGKLSEQTGIPQAAINAILSEECTCKVDILANLAAKLGVSLFGFFDSDLFIKVELENENEG